MANVTKKPTGLVITRDGNKFKTTWKIADANYKDGQQLKRRLVYAESAVDENKHDPDTTVDIGRLPENEYTVDVSKYLPNTPKRLHALQVWVRGNREAYTSKGKTKSDELATMLYIEAAKHFTGQTIRKEFSDGDPDWEEGFYILRKTKCPAVLTENFFMDNEQDLAYLTSEEGREAIVRTHVAALINWDYKYGKD